MIDDITGGILECIFGICCCYWFFAIRNEKPESQFNTNHIRVGKNVVVIDEQPDK
jgi:hypothetical protein